MSEVCNNCDQQMKAAYVTIPHPLALGHPDGEKHPMRVIGYHCENVNCLYFTALPDEGCHANRDGDCSWSGCPQLRDGEPMKSGRHCPLDIKTDEEYL